MKKVTFITTGQPTTNPRLVKEAELLKALGYDVHVIYCFYQAWAEKYDLEIVSRNPGMYTICGGHPENDKLHYFKTRLRQKICSIIFKFINWPGIAENAINRTYEEAKSVARLQRSGLYIAHNLGALPVAVIAAGHNKAKVGYDAEDMHSGQFISEQDDGYRLNKYIEEKYFTKIDYFTAASPLIAENYKNVYRYLEPTVINNVFPKTGKVIVRNPDESAPLKLFWFSQTVGPDRGLEQVIEAIGLSKRYILFELLGHCSATYLAYIKDFAKNKGLGEDQLKIHKAVSPEGILKIAAGFDIGMASETGSPLNRDICLTNKIFTYLQCGLCILASDTRAQTLFLEQYPLSGQLYNKNDPRTLATLLSMYDKDRYLLFQTKKFNYALGQDKLNWEHESLQFIKLIENV
ncbi:hypothetical protein KXD93_21160 [Mucilaginibacter sp. BJC16-A38]|uniref:hypothetical protein n=1 Tax=Mucilaginibacter phenanthrenivorans TaxID=1234842 RepID=UPI002158406B|nr:hypothetical protein [Mucilaginibacter phenanthrenivorans]MCR8560175.1 hypothetical protein [Mucilaginibacter phenanthrenivorans]